MGAGERLRESFPDLVVAAAEPLPGDEVMGLRSLADGYVPPILDVAKLDRKLLVTNAESVAGLRLLLEREGDLRGRLLRSRASTRPSTREGARRRRRRLRARRRGLEVPLGRVLGGGRRRRGDGAVGLVVVPEGCAGSSPTTPRPRRRTRPAVSWRFATASPSATSPAATPPNPRIASSSTSIPSPGSSRTRATSSPSSTRTSPLPPRPSRTDVENIGLWAGRPYLIYTLRTGELAAWTIANGTIEPLPLT